MYIIDKEIKYISLNQEQHNTQTHILTKWNALWEEYLGLHNSW